MRLLWARPRSGYREFPIIGAKAAVDDVPTANVKQPEFKIENGASLHVLRPAKFIEPDEVFWKSNTKKFTEATGVDVKVDFVSWEDLRPQLAVVANTGAGADIVISFGTDPHIYSSKLVELTDLADYLGAKYGGWYDLSLLVRHGNGTPRTGSAFRSVAAPALRCIASRGSTRLATTKSRMTSTTS